MSKKMSLEELKLSLFSLIIKEKGNWERIYNSLEGQKHMTDSQLRETDARMKKIHEMGWNAISIIDSDFPKCFQKNENLFPPYALFVKGNLYDGHKIEFVKNIYSAPDDVADDVVLITENIDGEMEDFRTYYLKNIMASEGFHVML